MKAQLEPKSGRWVVEVPASDVADFIGVMDGNRKVISVAQDGGKTYALPATYVATNTLIRLGCKFPKPGAKDLFLGQHVAEPDAPKFPWAQWQKARPEFITKNKIKPMAHQKAAIDKFYPMRVGGIFHQPGTGKTFTYITLACSWYPHRATQVVVVCPNAVVENWEEEIGKYAWVPTEVYKYDGSASRSRIERLITRPKPDKAMRWLIMSVESLSQGQAGKFMTMFTNMAPTAMAVDESQRIKNWKSERTKVCIDTGDLAVRRHSMTGSPITQKMEELYAAGLYLDKRIIGHENFWTFRNRYCIMGGFKRKQIVGYTNEEELMANFGPFCDVVEKKEALKDLPPKMFEKRHYQLTEQQIRIIESIHNKRIIGEHEIANVLEAFLRMQQVCGGTVPDEFNVEMQGNPKLDAVMEATLDEFSHCQIVIWCKYISEVNFVCARLAKTKETYVRLVGEVPREERQRLLTQFEAGKFRIAVGNPASIGVGVDKLKTAEVSLFYSNSFSWEEREQAEDRVHRKGVKSTDKRLYIDFLAKGSVDEYISECLAKTMDVADAIRQQLDIAGKVFI